MLCTLYIVQHPKIKINITFGVSMFHKGIIFNKKLTAYCILSKKQLCLKKSYHFFSVLERKIVRDFFSVNCKIEFVMWTTSCGT